jgi:hypothetical protein
MGVQVITNESHALDDLGLRSEHEEVVRLAEMLRRDMGRLIWLGQPPQLGVMLWWPGECGKAKVIRSLVPKSFQGLCDITMTKHSPKTA